MPLSGSHLPRSPKEKARGRSSPPHQTQERRRALPTAGSLLANRMKIRLFSLSIGAILKERLSRFKYRDCFPQGYCSRCLKAQVLRSADFLSAALVRVQNPPLRRSLLLAARGEAGPGRRGPPQTGTRWAPAHPYDAEGLQEEPGQPLTKPPARRRAGRAAGAALCARSGKFSAQLLGPPATISISPKPRRLPGDLKRRLPLTAARRRDVQGAASSEAPGAQLGT